MQCLFQEVTSSFSSLPKGIYHTQSCNQKWQNMPLWVFFCSTLMLLTYFQTFSMIGFKIFRHRNTVLMPSHFLISLYCHGKWKGGKNKKDQNFPATLYVKMRIDYHTIWRTFDVVLRISLVVLMIFDTLQKNTRFDSEVQETSNRLNYDTHGLQSKKNWGFNCLIFSHNLVSHR